MPKLVDAPNEDALSIEAARKNAEAVRDKVDAAKAEIERLRKLREDLDKQLAQASQDAAAKAQEIAIADERLRLAQRMVVPDKVTEKVVLALANKIVEIFDGFTAHKVQLDEFWKRLDAVRDRLLTTEIEEGFEQLVMAIEGCIFAADRWEKANLMLRGGEQFAETIGNGPPECRQVQNAFIELKATLNGDEPKAIETPGQLVGAGVELRQVCRTMRLVYPGGEPALQEFGQLLDAGWSPKPCFGFVRWYGTFLPREAWKMRQSNIEGRRNLPPRAFGTSACGAQRPGRVHLPPTDADFERLQQWKATR